jgi:hypothetical protein
MSRVESKINEGDRIVWSHVDTNNGINLILSGVVGKDNRRTTAALDTYLVNDIKMHSMESIKGIPADTRLQFPSPAYIPKDNVKKLADGVWK